MKKSNIELTSNAFNFGNFYSTGVDKRTGTFNLSLKLGTLNSSGNLSQTLNIGYNPLSSVDEGFGSGWRLNISRFDFRNKRLYLSNGKSFPLSKSSSSSVEFRYLKQGELKTQYKNGELTLIYKDGRKEEFDNDGFLTRVVAPTGHYHEYKYRNDRLIQITDTEGKYLEIDYRGSLVSVTLSDGKEQSECQISNGNLNRFTFADRLQVFINYINIEGFSFIDEVKHPSGKIDRVFYDRNGLSLPSGAPFRRLPVVMKHEAHDGFSNAVKTYQFSYSSNNYLGFDTQRFNEHYDSLYEYDREYLYSVTVEDEFTMLEVEYNKFHLVTKESYFDKASGKPLRHTFNTYYADSNKDFEGQPEQYLYLKSAKEVVFNASGESREVETITNIDNYGNLTYQKDAFGMESRFEYYTAEEINADPNLHIPHLLKKSETTASQKYASGKELPHIVNAQYQALKTLDNSGVFFVLSEKQDFVGTKQVYAIKKTYHENRNDLYSFGCEAITTSVGTAKTSISKVFRENGNQVDVIETENYHDGLTKEITQTYCKYTRNVLRSVDHMGRERTFSFDLLHRPVTEVVSPNTAYEIVKTTSYDDENNVVELFENNKFLQKNTSDSFGRHISTTFANVGGTPYVKEKKVYDSLDRVIAQHEFDTRHGETNEYVTTMDYSNWWQTRSMTPDGAVNVVESDPVAMSEVTYAEVGGKRHAETLSVKNELGSALITKASNAEIHNTYDGFNRLIKTTDSKGVVTEFELDEFEREIKKTVHAETATVYEKRYAPLHLDETISEVIVNGAVMGKRSHDGLGRIISETRVGKDVFYTYGSLSEIPTEVRMPNGSVSYNEIDHELDVIIKQTNSDGEERHFIFDKQKSVMTSESNGHFECTYTYDDSDDLVSQTQHGRQAKYQYSTGGLLTKFTDWFGSTEVRHYNHFNALSQVVSDTSITDINYDAFRRMSDITIKDTVSNQTMVHQYVYDEVEADELVEIITSLDGREIKRQIHEYDDQGSLISREIIGENGSSTLEQFEYNLLNQLVKMLVSGTERPAFYNLGTITEQVFERDDFGNLVRLTTQFIAADGSTQSDEATYTYANQCLLTDIHHSHPELTAERFQHDENGNVLNGEDGMTMTYNADDRLKTVYSAQGDVLAEYKYAPNGQLLTQAITGQDPLHFFYSMNTLTHEMQSDVHSKFVIANGVNLGRVLNQAHGRQFELNVLDFKGSLIELIAPERKTKTYSAYGYMGEA